MVVSIIYINLLFFFFMKIIEYNFDEAERPEAYLYLVDLDVIIIYINLTKLCTRFLCSVNLCICSKGIQIMYYTQTL